MSSTLSDDLFLYQILYPPALQQSMYEILPTYHVTSWNFFMQYMCKSNDFATGHRLKINFWHCVKTVGDSWKNFGLLPYLCFHKASAMLGHTVT